MYKFVKKNLSDYCCYKLQILHLLLCYYVGLVLLLLLIVMRITCIMLFHFCALYIWRYLQNPAKFSKTLVLFLSSDIMKCMWVNKHFCEKKVLTMELQMHQWPKLLFSAFSKTCRIFLKVACIIKFVIW